MAAIRWGTHSRDQSFTAFSNWLTLMAPVPAPTSQGPVIACDQTQRALQALGLNCPKVDVGQLKKQVHFLVRKKLLSLGDESGPVPASCDAPAGQPKSLVPLQAGGSDSPWFCIHGLGGQVAALLPLAKRFAGERPVYGLQALGLDAGQEPQQRIEEMAALYVKEIREVQPQGPYLLGGWSMGGLIALEAAGQLCAAGQAVPLVAMFDTYPAAIDLAGSVDDQSVLLQIAAAFDVPVGALERLPLEQQWQRVVEAAGVGGAAEVHRLAAVCKAQLHALSHYTPRPHAGACTLFAARQGMFAGFGRSDQDHRWTRLCPKLRVEVAPGDHFSMLREPNVQVLAGLLGRHLSDGEGRESRP